MTDGERQTDRFKSGMNGYMDGEKEKGRSPREEVR